MKLHHENPKVTELASCTLGTVYPAEYEKENGVDHLRINIGNFYSVQISFAELARLVRYADRCAKDKTVGAQSPDLKNWKNFE